MSYRRAADLVGARLEGCAGHIAYRSKVGYLVFQVGAVAGEFQVELTDFLMISKFHFNALVRHRTNVARGISCGADVGRQHDRLQHPGGLLVVPVERQGKVGEERRFKADIELAGLLPFQIRVGRGVGAVANHVVVIAEGVVPAAANRGDILKIADVVVSVHPIGSADLQEGHHLVLRPETLA